MSGAREPEVIVIDDSDDEPAAPPQRAPPPQRTAPAPQAVSPPAHRFRLEERHGDLFTVDARVSLAHCVARDLRLGKGIAKEFKARFGGVEDMHRQRVPIGGVATLRVGPRWIYALVSKERSSRCYPTMAQLRSALVALRERAAHDGVSALAMPRLGCGLDRLAWPDVRSLIVDVFRRTDVHIIAYQWP